VAAAHTSVAAVLLDQGKPQQALASYELAAAIRRAAFGDRHKGRGDDEYHLAKVKRILGDQKAACEHATQALEIHEAQLGKSAPATADDLVEVGLCQLSRHRRRDAIQSLTRAHAIYVSLEQSAAATDVAERLAKLGVSLP
jgi:tetratricopeptide (TPR) repeat protein